MRYNYRNVGLGYDAKMVNGVLRILMIVTLWGRCLFILNFLFRLLAEVGQMKMFGSANAVDGKMPLMITSQDDKLGTSLYMFQ